MPAGTCCSGEKFFRPQAVPVFCRKALALECKCEVTNSDSIHQGQKQEKLNGAH